MTEWKTVRVDVVDGIGWVELNRPDKRNAMNPTLNAEMIDVLHTLEADRSCGVVVITGAGEAWSAGMDLKEYFREVDESGDEALQARVRRDAFEWHWRLLVAHGFGHAAAAETVRSSCSGVWASEGNHASYCEAGA